MRTTTKKQIAICVTTTLTMMFINVCAKGRPGVSAYQLNEKQPTWASILDAEYWAYNNELHIGIAYTVKLDLC